MQLRPESRERIARAIRDHLGLVFPIARVHALDLGVDRTAQHLGVTDEDLFVERIARGDAQALETLGRELTVGETYFFRDANHFALLKEHVLAPAAAAGRKVRLWSAGCATGEEAYSLAIAAVELGIDVEVLATDLNTTFLERARAGLYGAWSFRGVSDATKRAWFTAEGKHLRVRAEIAARVRFLPLNLVTPAMTSPTGFDAVFCRNVLIYFDAPAIAHAAALLRDALVEGGVLITGPSDPLLEIAGLAIETVPGAILHRRVSAAAPPVPFPASREPACIEPERDVERVHVTVPLAPPTVPTADVEARAPPQQVAERGEDVDDYLRRANARLDEGDDVAALEELRRVLLLDRRHVMAHVLSVGPLRRLGEVSRAKRALAQAESALAAVPDDTPVPGARGANAADVRAVIATLSRATMRT